MDDSSVYRHLLWNLFFVVVVTVHSRFFPKKVPVLCPHWSAGATGSQPLPNPPKS